MLRKFIGIFAFMFMLALVVPVAAQRYNRGYSVGNNRGHHDRYDRNRNYSSYRRDYNRNRNYRYVNYNNGYNRSYNRSYNRRTRYYTYSPGYYNNNYYVVRRAPIRRYYRPVYSPRYYGNRNRSRVRISFGF